MSDVSIIFAYNGDDNDICCHGFQNNFHDDLHIRIIHQNTRPWFHSGAVYILKRPMELVGLHCNNVSVSISIEAASGQNSEEPRRRCRDSAGSR